MMTIKPFSADISGNIPTYGDCSEGQPEECPERHSPEEHSPEEHSPEEYPDLKPDSFETNPLARRRLYGKWMLLTTGSGLEIGYKRVKGALKVEPTEADKAANLFFAGKKITPEQEKILETGWPKIFKGVFAEGLSKENFQDPETEKKAKEFHWTIWEKKIPRDENGKIDPRVLTEEKKAFEVYWREILRVMNRMYTPGRKWGIQYGEFYHRDVGWY